MANRVGNTIVSEPQKRALRRLHKYGADGASSIHPTFRALASKGLVSRDVGVFMVLHGTVIDRGRWLLTDLGRQIARQLDRQLDRASGGSDG